LINDRVFSTIRDINETLALTNEPGRLINMSLDTLSQVMGIECCWIQTVDEARHHRLSAQRGLSPEMQAELAALDMGQGLAEEIIGLGHRVVIPDLSTDGAYGLASFRKAGFKWLVAVPLMTYRVHGILGIASRSKKTLKKETPELTMVIGGLIGTALNKSRLFQKSLKKSKPNQPRPEGAAKPLKRPETGPETDEMAAPPGERPPSRREEGTFDIHARRMKKFRGSHQPGQ
jgi:signal transduction protein with GAF and PtsI domain